MANNPWSRTAKPKGKLNLLAKRASTNGKVAAKPSLAAITKGKPTDLEGAMRVTLAALVKDDPAKKVSLAAALGLKPPVSERPYQAPKPRVAEDFRSGGVLFSGAEITGETTRGYKAGMSRAYGTVDITNGDQTYTMHNRNGSWMHDVWEGGGKMAEPARVAQWLGIDMSQIDISRALTRRFEAEMKKQGVLTTHQQRVKLDEQATLTRKRAAKKPPAKETTTVPKKITLKGLGSK